MTTRAFAAGLALAAALAAAAAWLAVSSDREQALVTGVVAVVAGLEFAVTGLVARWRRPRNRTGTYLVLTGYLWFLAALQASDGELAFSLGVLLGNAAFVPFTALVLAFPTGRLRTTADRLLPLLVGVHLAVLGALMLLVDDVVWAGCDDCPESAFAVLDSNAAETAVLAVGTVVSAALVAAGVWILARRWRVASPALRRVLTPVYATSGLTLVVVAVANVATRLSDAAGRALSVVFLVSFATVPIAFLYGILRSRLARSSVADLLAALAAGAPLRSALAGALGDPTLSVAYWSERRHGWVDADGRPVALPEPSRTRTVTTVEREGRRVAALVHDASLGEEPELVGGVAAAAGLALENERLQAELRAQVETLQTIVSTAPSLLSVVDVDGHIVSVNRAVEEAVALTAEDLHGRFFWDVFIDPAEREEMIGRFHRAAPEFVAADYENAFTNAAGEERVIAWRAAPLRDAGGTVVNVVAGGIDVTERRRRERDVERHRDFLNIVTEAVPSFLVAMDGEGTVVDDGVNRAFEETFGWTRTELGGTPFLDLVAPEDDWKARMAIAGAANGAAQPPRESRWLTRAGEPRIVSWTALPLADVAGRDLVLVSAMDVTEQAERDEELRASRARIVEAADQARRRLERDLHDGAQQRLVSLSVSLSLVESRIATDPAAASALLAAAREELSLALDELRELARGIHPAVLTDRGLAAALDALVSRAPLPVSVAVPAERLPGPVEAAVYYVSAEALTNVAKYAGAASASIRVARVDGVVTVEVSDDGVGGASLQGGTGLRGLRDRVAALGGTLEVVSPEDGGTRVVAEIPVPEPAPAE